MTLLHGETPTCMSQLHGDTRPRVCINRTCYTYMTQLYEASTCCIYPYVHDSAARGNPYVHVSAARGRNGYDSAIPLA